MALLLRVSRPSSIGAIKVNARTRNPSIHRLDVWVPALVGLIGLVTILVLVERNPRPTQPELMIWWIVLALSAAAFVVALPGIFGVALTLFGISIRATGAIGVFAVVMFFPPAQKMLSQVLSIPPRPHADERFLEGSDGTLQDKITGLTWTQNDNAKDIAWAEAKRYCESHGGGWRLPYVAELKAIWNRDVPGTNRCLVGAAIPEFCRVSEKFHLTQAGFWSSEKQPGTEDVLMVGLIYGVEKAMAADNAAYMRVLCVRGDSVQ